MMELFGRYNVEFVSATEKFDTSTPMGRAMLNICIVFAQLERETIQKRVQDSYFSRCQKGYFMSGQAPYGFRLTPTIMDGIHTKMYEADPETADHVRLMYEMYARHNTSFGDIIRYFENKRVDIKGIELSRSQLSQTLRNPVYVQADLDVYEFFKNEGAVIVNDAADFTGANGCYLYTGRDTGGNKNVSAKGHILVIAPHEGLVSPDTWLTCRKKLMNNTAFPGQHKAKSTWLAGKVKCGKCGAGLMNYSQPGRTRYFRCRRHADAHTCPGCGTIRVHELEDSIYGEMHRKVTEFQAQICGGPDKVNPKLTAFNVELAQVEAEIGKLLDNLAMISATREMMLYANERIVELDAKRQSLTKAIADIKAAAISPERMKSISGYLKKWDTITFEDRQLTLDSLVSRINATSENVQIEWKA